MVNYNKIIMANFGLIFVNLVVAGINVFSFGHWGNSFVNWWMEGGMFWVWIPTAIFTWIFIYIKAGGD